MTVLTLNIREPKTSVHLTPSLDDVREIQVIDFVRVRKPFVRLTEQQKVYNLTGGDQVELFGFNRGVFTIEDLQQAFTRVNKAIDTLNVLHRTRSTRNSYSWQTLPFSLELSKILHV